MLPPAYSINHLLNDHKPSGSSFVELHAVVTDVAELQDTCSKLQLDPETVVALELLHLAEAARTRVLEYFGMTPPEEVLLAGLAPLLSTTIATFHDLTTQYAILPLPIYRDLVLMAHRMIKTPAQELAYDPHQ